MRRIVFASHSLSRWHFNVQSVAQKTWIVFGLLIPLCLNGQNIVINEFASDNEQIIQDKHGDYSDWLELYNTTNDTLSLDGHYLSDDLYEPMKWAFPPINILPGDYLLVFASKKNLYDSIEIHTNFKIDSDGEILVLSDATGSIVDLLEPITLDFD